MFTLLAALPIVQILIAVLIIALVFYVISLIPMDVTLRRIVHVILAVLVILWLLGLIGYGWG